MLFDLYGGLLTDHQRAVYGQLVNEDLSLSELAEQYGITRQGVHDIIRRCDRIMEGYEDKLHLLSEELSHRQTSGHHGSDFKDAESSEEIALSDDPAASRGFTPCGNGQA